MKPKRGDKFTVTGTSGYIISDKVVIYQFEWDRESGDSEMCVVKDLDGYYHISAVRWLKPYPPLCKCCGQRLPDADL